MTKVRARRRAGWSSVFVLAALLAAGAVLLTAGPAAAGGTVTCPPENGTDVQNAINGGGTVTINGTCHGNFTVTGVTVTIQGGSPGATLNGDANDSVLTITDSTVTIKNLTITNGLGDCDGGGIYAEDSTVNLFNTTVTGNTTACGSGGGIFVEDSSLNLTASKVTNNTAADGSGGGIDADEATVTLTNSTVSNNHAESSGGGINVDDAYLALTGSTVSNNVSTTTDTTGLHGGGVVADFSVMYANASTFASNRVSSSDSGGPAADGGGIETFSSNVQLVASRVLGNLANDDGGGIAFVNSCEFCFASLRTHVGTVKTAAFPSPFDIPEGLTLDGTTVDHNQAGNAGGGIESETFDTDVPVTLTNSTVSNNVTLDTSTFGESGGAGIAQFGDSDEDNPGIFTASLTTANTNIYGNRSGSLGGGILNISFHGPAVVSTGQTTNFQSPNALQVGNQAKFGGGVYNAGLDASVSLNAGTKMARNKATINGGGVFNDCGASLFVAPGVVLLANYPNNIFTNLGGCLIE